MLTRRQGDVNRYAMLLCYALLLAISIVMLRCTSVSKRRQNLKTIYISLTTDSQYTMCNSLYIVHTCQSAK